MSRVVEPLLDYIAVNEISNFTIRDLNVFRTLEPFNISIPEVRTLMYSEAMTFRPEFTVKP